MLGADPASTTAAADPATTAVDISVLESEGRFSEVYDVMHPDAQAIIPREAVVGWYENDFAPLGPGVITVTGVQYVTWTWPVTGQSYPNTAEVSFTQPFANGSVVTEVVRLVESGGQWHWFFGRSKEFVDAQIAKYPGVPAQKPNSNAASYCDGAAEWWRYTFPNILAGMYLGDSLNGVAGQGYPDRAILDEYYIAFGNLFAWQAELPYPPAAASIQSDFLLFLQTYQHVAEELAILSGGTDPYTESAVVSSLSQRMDRIGNILTKLPYEQDGFTACDPLVVFVYGMGEDLPSGVLPGEVEPSIPVIDCTHFPTPARAQRFYEAAGAGDPHRLDSDGDGVVCESRAGGPTSEPASNSGAEATTFSVMVVYCDARECSPVAGVRFTYESQDGTVKGTCMTEYVEGPNGTIAMCDYKYVRGMPTLLTLDVTSTPNGTVVVSPNPQTYLVPQNPDGVLGPVYFELGPR